MAMFSIFGDFLTSKFIFSHLELPISSSGKKIAEDGEHSLPKL
jgi:hypothetical protein